MRILFCLDQGSPIYQLLGSGGHEGLARHGWCIYVSLTAPPRQTLGVSIQALLDYSTVTVRV